MNWLHPFRTMRRRRATSVPFPAEWDRILARNFPLADRLPDRAPVRLREHIQIFLTEKHFEGLGGLDITDEIRVIIAAQACLLVLNLKDAYYPRLSSILVYPGAYRAPARRYEEGIVTEFDEVRLGESWDIGAIVLSWDDVLQDVSDFTDGFNVVLHEFAHQLDSENPGMDGTPNLPDRGMYADWQRVMTREFEQLNQSAARGRHTFLDPYGATHPAEFFAVATETFFEQPAQLRTLHPELYEQLKAYYRQDPVTY